MIPLGLQSTALTGAEIIINRALQYDPATRAQLAELSGRSMQVEISSPSLTINLICRGEQITLHNELPSESKDEPDVSVKGSASALAAMAMQGGDTIAGRGIEVRGSLDVLQQLKSIFSDLDVDWEAALAELVGELPAHLVVKAARSTHQWQQQTRPRAMAVAANFVRDEAKLTPAKVEVEQFRKNVRQLATDVDRLAARINRIKLHLSQQQSQQQNSPPEGTNL